VPPHPHFPQARSHVHTIHCYEPLPTALLTDYTACCQMEYNIVLFTMLYYNLDDTKLSQLGLQGGNEKKLKMRAQRSSSSGGRVRNIRRRRQRVGDGVPAMHGTRRQPASGGRNRPSPTSSRRTRRTFQNRAARQTTARHQRNSNVFSCRRRAAATGSVHDI